MYLAANGVPVTSSWTGRATFPAQGVFRWNIVKVDVFSNGTDVVMQALEEGTGWQEDVNQEILLPMGFNAVEPVTTWRAVRFKVWENTLLPPTGNVHVRIFG